MIMEICKYLVHRRALRLSRTEPTIHSATRENKSLLVLRDLDSFLIHTENQVRPAMGRQRQQESMLRTGQRKGNHEYRAQRDLRRAIEA